MQVWEIPSAEWDVIGSIKPAMANDLIPVQPAALPAEMLDLMGRARGYADKAKSDGPRRAYASDWLDFAEWCIAWGFDALPTLPAVIGLYLTDRADTLKPASLSRRLAAISVQHRAGGYHLDTRHPAIR